MGASEELWAAFANGSYKDDGYKKNKKIKIKGWEKSKAIKKTADF